MDPFLMDIPLLSVGPAPEGRTLPPRPASICHACWQGLFAIHFGLPCQIPDNEGQFYRRWDSSHSYSTSFLELKSRALAGCAWCQLLVAILEELRTRNSAGEPSDPLNITVRGVLDHHSERTPEKYQTLEVAINSNHPIFSGVVHAASGMFASRSMGIVLALTDILRRQRRALYRFAKSSARSRLSSCPGSCQRVYR